MNVNVSIPGGGQSAWDLVEVSRGMRTELAKTAAEVDRRGEYPESNIRRIEESPLGSLAVPRSLGGSAADDLIDDLVPATEILANLAAGESSTAQIWKFTSGPSLHYLGNRSPLGDDAKGAIWSRWQERPVRFCSSAAERYKKRWSFEMPCRRVDGGVVISGTKYFATGIDGADYAHVPVLMEGFDSYEEGGAYEVLVDLRAPGVELHHDWDNVGQRATVSGAVTYHDVFVPDGFHWKPAVGLGFTSPSTQVGMAALCLGIGMGALDALAEFIQHRTSYTEAASDPVIQYQVGRYAYLVSAAEAAVAAAAEACVEYEKHARLSLDEANHRVHCAKLMALEAATTIGGEMVKLCGGQASANSYGLDRFWRNARTMSVQDVMDLRQRNAGAYALAAGAASAGGK